ncbi:MAG: ribosome small subunit-dependent GTPase A [Candidatus Kapaibacteriota bacterium]
MKIKKVNSDNLDSDFKYQRTNKRILIKEKHNKKEALVTARVIIIISKSIFIETQSNNIYEATLSGVIESKNLDSSIVAVGDYVDARISSTHKGKSGYFTALIVKIHNRKSVFSRKANGLVPYEQVIASNITDLLVIVSVKSPKYNTRLLDRIIISGQLNGLKCGICINKTDLAETNDFEKDFDIYQSIGIPLFYISLLENKNLINLLSYLNGKETVIIGQSGVGKSTFINILFKEEIQKTKNISQLSDKGKHTTSFVRMFNYEDKFKIIDTPGIREFGIWGLDKRDLTFYFPEFNQYQSQCKYQPCTHTHEPGCKVVEAVESNLITFARYQSYLNILETI